MCSPAPLHLVQAAKIVAAQYCTAAETILTLEYLLGAMKCCRRPAERKPGDEEMSAFEDRFEIRELIDRWSDAVNEHDWEALGSCFVEDGIWDVGQPLAFKLEGRDLIKQVVAAEVEKQEYVIQTGHAVVIKLNGDTATARATMQEFMRGKDGSGMQMWGTYYDDLVRTPEGWKFKLRRFRYAIFEPTPMPGAMHRGFGEIV